MSMPIPDYRHNAPPTIARLHGDDRADALYRRGESRRQRYMLHHAPKPVQPTRQRGSWAVRYEYWLTAVLIFALTIWAVSR